MSLKSIEESSLMTIKNDTKSEEVLIYHFKIDMRILTGAVESLKNSHFNVLLLSKVYIV